MSATQNKINLKEAQTLSSTSINETANPTLYPDLNNVSHFCVNLSSC